MNEDLSIIDILTAERDEARNAARYAFKRWEWLIVGLASYQEEFDEIREKYLWLKEEDE